jgi:hypothetical protein
LLEPDFGLPDFDPLDADALASIGRNVFFLPSHSVSTEVGLIARILASATLSPTLYHLPLINAL